MCLAFSLFHPPAAQIDCCVTGFTGLHLQNIFARFTWLFGICELDMLVFCWNLKGEQFLTSYCILLLLIIYISFNYWLMNKLTVKRMCDKFVDLLHAHGMTSAKQYNQSTYNTKKVTQDLPTMHRNNITIKTIYISQIENLLEWKYYYSYINYLFETQTNLIKIFIMLTILLLLNITSL